MSESMRAVRSQARRTGATPLRGSPKPVPVPAPSEVLVAVRAASITSG